MAKLFNDVTSVIEALVNNDLHSAIKYLSDKEVVKATRKLFNGKIDKKGNVEIILTIGKPNYQERKFIKQAKKLGEPFPIKKIQFKQIPKRRT